LSRNLTSIEDTTIGVASARLARAISLTVSTSWTVGITSTRSGTNTSGDIAEGLAGDFTSIVNAVRIGHTSLAETTLHAVVSLSAGASSVGGASVNAETSAEVTVRLSRDFTSIGCATSRRGSTR